VGEGENERLPRTILKEEEIVNLPQNSISRYKKWSGGVVNGQKPQRFLAFQRITLIKDNDQMHLQRKSKYT
jgi:hypothetical protein